jgi:hypothetical protein
LSVGILAWIEAFRWERRRGNGGWAEGLRKPIG